MIYSAKTMGYIRQQLWDILWHILFKIVGYICKTMGFIQKDNGIILGKNYGIYWAKTIGYIMGNNCQNYGIYLQK